MSQSALSGKWRRRERVAFDLAALTTGSDHDFGEIAGSFFRGVVIRSTLLQQLDEMEHELVMCQC
jgi:hypothetical protein